MRLEKALERVKWYFDRAADAKIRDRVGWSLYQAWKDQDADFKAAQDEKARQEKKEKEERNREEWEKIMKRWER